MQDFTIGMFAVSFGWTMLVWAMRRNHARLVRRLEAQLASRARYVEQLQDAYLTRYGERLAEQDRQLVLVRGER